MINLPTGALLRRVMLGAAVTLLANAPVAAQTLPEVLAARVSTTAERARLVVDLTAPASFSTVSLLDPERIAVDLKVSAVHITGAPSVAGQGIVASFVAGMAADGQAQVELTLTQPAVVQQAYMLDVVGDQPARLVVDLIVSTDTDFKARAASDLAGALALRGSDAASEASPASSSDTVGPDGSAEPAMAPSEAASVPEPQSVEPPSSAEVPSESAAADNAPPSLSKPLIVLDPGHGGVDNGASAPNGDHEKDITLAFTLQLRDALVQSGHFDVALTRDDDTYLTLNERVALARQNRADLFVSLHADTFQQADIRGASIYTRDETATDILDKVLADGENRADIVAGYVSQDSKPAVVSILVDLMRRQARQQAFVAASDIVKSMEPNVALRRFPVRQADFFVLQAPDVPSVLIELGFLSNSEDIANLENQAWRQTMIKAISQGIEAYFTDLRGSSGGGRRDALTRG
ncbi:MAG: N-acetylmuramoyl-L-alanine amidase [Devosia sp.]